MKNTKFQSYKEKDKNSKKNSFFYVIMNKGETMKYVVNINDFEGPLDLLLHLIKKNNISIYEVQIEEITKQYLDYISKMEQMNLDIASEYLVMASELMEIKSKSLLPNNNIDEEEEDPRERLIERLLEYSKYKELTTSFHILEEERKKIHTKEPSSTSEYTKQSEITDDLTLQDLLDAFSKFLQKQEKKKPLNTTVTTKEYSVKERSLEIRNILKKRKKIVFTELFSEFNKSYIIVTFLSILDLAREKEITLRQDKQFGEIFIEGGNV